LTLAVFYKFGNISLMFCLEPLFYSFVVCFFSCILACIYLTEDYVEILLRIISFRLFYMYTNNLKHFHFLISTL